MTINPPISNFGFDDEDDGSRGPIPRREDLFMDNFEPRDFSSLKDMDEAGKTQLIQMVIDICRTIDNIPDDGLFDVADRAIRFTNDIATAYDIEG